MVDISDLVNALRRLNEMQFGRLRGWGQALTARERAIAVQLSREALPDGVWTHHERLATRGKRSLAPVKNRVCGACHIQLPSGHRHPSTRGGDLDVCENCGVFLEWPDSGGDKAPA